MITRIPAFELTAGSHITLTDSGATRTVDWRMNLRKRVLLFSDMNTAADWTLYANGAGTTGVFTTTGLASAGYVGILDCGTGTTAAGWSGVSHAERSSVLLGTYETRYLTVAKIPTLGTAGEAINVVIGFHDRANSLTPTDGAYFNYHHGTNSGKWQAIIYTAGVTAGAEDTGITADTGWHSFAITTTTTTTTFAIDGVTVNTQAGVTGGATASDARITKTVGTTARNLYVDLMSLEMDCAR